jgi:hypothetical protein
MRILRWESILESGLTLKYNTTDQIYLCMIKRGNTIEVGITDLDVLSQVENKKIRFNSSYL